MSTFPLNLIVFSTTMGHGGKHTYKEVIERLLGQMDACLFANKVLHLKSREGEAETADEIKS